MDISKYIKEYLATTSTEPTTKEHLSVNPTLNTGETSAEDDFHFFIDGYPEQITLTSYDFENIAKATRLINSVRSEIQNLTEDELSAHVIPEKIICQRENELATSYDKLENKARLDFQDTISSFAQQIFAFLDTYNISVEDYRDVVADFGNDVSETNETIFNAIRHHFFKLKKSSDWNTDFQLVIKRLLYIGLNDIERKMTMFFDNLVLSLKQIIEFRDTEYFFINEIKRIGLEKFKGCYIRKYMKILRKNKRLCVRFESGNGLLEYQSSLYEVFLGMIDDVQSSLVKKLTQINELAEQVLPETLEIIDDDICPPE